VAARALLGQKLLYTPAPEPLMRPRRPEDLHLANSFRSRVLASALGLGLLAALAACGEQAAAPTATAIPAPTATPVSMPADAPAAVGTSGPAAVQTGAPAAVQTGAPALTVAP
jgi:hypothetical protein